MFGLMCFITFLYLGSDILTFLSNKGHSNIWLIKKLELNIIEYFHKSKLFVTNTKIAIVDTTLINKSFFTILTNDYTPQKNQVISIPEDIT